MPLFFVNVFSFHLNGALNKAVVELNKKRKLQTEQFDLPISKHKRWDHQLLAEHLRTLDESQEVEDFFIHVRKAYSEGQAFDDGSDHESGKDSNNFIGDSDSAQSVTGEAKYEAEASKIWSSDWPSTSWCNWGFNSFRHAQCSSDDGKEESTFMGGKGQAHHSHIGLHASEEPEGPIPESGAHLDSEFKYENIEQNTDDQLDDILYSNEVNPNVYVLSSGRWTVNQGTETGARKPTIDQEFEQYFSMLML
uniref:Uncharacterized protein LOC8258385 n=1 Tax=Rhizophora mucronata TaxID=61149 RepID=A0A2P2JDX5_RHIMU